MKTYKVCFSCISDLQYLRHTKENGMKLSKNCDPTTTCKIRPRCFDQPERSKREDSQKCEMRCSEHCRNAVREVQKASSPTE